MPETTGQAKGNSGVFLQGRYEIQVPDLAGLPCRSRGLRSDLTSLPRWLTRAALLFPMAGLRRFFARRARRTVGPRITALHNGQLIHNNVVPGVTGAALDEEVTRHGLCCCRIRSDLVCYRNIWIVEQPLVRWIPTSRGGCFSSGWTVFSYKASHSGE